MLKKISVSVIGSLLLVAACAPPEPQAGFKSDAESTEQEGGDADDGGDEDCAPDEGDDATAGSKTKAVTEESAAVDPSALSKCACKAGGTARCVPSDKVPATFSKQLDACDDGVCLPDFFLESHGAAPKTCKSVAGEGRCMSLCIPGVADKKEVLDRGAGDACETDERCVPCLNPLDGNKPTGVCEIGKGSSSSSGAGKKCAKKKKVSTTPSDDTKPSDGASCPYKGTPIDVSKFPACGSGGRCVPTTAVPADLRSRLDACAGGLCAPEKSVANMGNYLPPTCQSVGGAEGRCLSTVVKDVAEKKGLLQQGSCDANELCAPCFSPIDGSDTGACRSVSCDAPKTKAKPLTACCEGKGKCVPIEAVSSDLRERLDSKGCSAGAELCAPSEDIGRTTKRPTCNGSMMLMGSYKGACVSRCTSLGLKGLFLDQATCDGDHVCAPCTDPLSGESTGACD